MMYSRKILSALCGASLLVTAPVAFAADSKLITQPKMADQSFRPLSQDITKSMTPQTRLAEHCGDNWWEFSLWQAIGCMLRKQLREK